MNQNTYWRRPLWCIYRRGWSPRPQLSPRRLREHLKTRKNNENRTKMTIQNVTDLQENIQICFQTM